MLPIFAGRLLAFDLPCTQADAALIAKAREGASTIGSTDGYIAAIAITNGISVATRDTAPFLAAGATVNKPWGR